MSESIRIGQVARERLAVHYLRPERAETTRAERRPRVAEEAAPGTA
jgi:hypothetical protein